MVHTTGLEVEGGVISTDLPQTADIPNKALLYLKEEERGLFQLQV